MEFLFYFLFYRGYDYYLYENFKFKLATLFFSVLPTNLTSFIAPSVLDNKLRHGSLLVNRALASFLAIKSYRVRLGIKH